MEEMKDADKKHGRYPVGHLGICMGARCSIRGPTDRKLHQKSRFRNPQVESDLATA